MIDDDDVLWEFKQSLHYDLLKYHFPLDAEDLEAYQFCMRDHANSDPFFRESMRRYIADLIKKYPGLVPITEEEAIENNIPLEAEKIAGLGLLPEDEIKRNVCKFGLWVGFEDLKRIPGCVFRQEEAFHLIFNCKEYGVSCEPEDLIFLLQCIGPPDISLTERSRMQAHSEIDNAMKMNGWSYEHAANEWWMCLHDKSVSELNEFERKCRVRSVRGAFDMLRANKNRLIKKRKELTEKMRNL